MRFGKYTSSLDHWYLHHFPCIYITSSVFTPSQITRGIYTRFTPHWIQPKPQGVFTPSQTIQGIYTRFSPPLNTTETTEGIYTRFSPPLNILKTIRGIYTRFSPLWKTPETIWGIYTRFSPPWKTPETIWGSQNGFQGLEIGRYEKQVMQLACLRRCTVIILSQSSISSLYQLIAPWLLMQLALHYAIFGNRLAIYLIPQWFRIHQSIMCRSAIDYWSCTCLENSVIKIFVFPLLENWVSSPVHAILKISIFWIFENFGFLDF